MNRANNISILLAILTSIVLLTACPAPLKKIKLVQKMESFLPESVEIICKSKRTTEPGKPFKLAPGEVAVLELGVAKGYTGDYRVEALACETEGKSFMLCQHASQFSSLVSPVTSNLDEVEVGYQLRLAGESCQKPFHHADPFLRMAGEWKTDCISKHEGDELHPDSTQRTLTIVGNTFHLVSRGYKDIHCKTEKKLVEVQGSLAVAEGNVWDDSSLGEVKASPAKASLTPKSEEEVTVLNSSDCRGNVPFAIDVSTELDVKRKCIPSIAPFALSSTLDIKGLALIDEHQVNMPFGRVVKKAE